MKKIVTVLPLLTLAIFVGLVIVYVLVSSHRQSEEVLSVNDKPPALSLAVPVMVIPHHLFAPEQIKETLQIVAKQNADVKIDRVILISPNHFHQGQAPIYVRAKDWTFGNHLYRVDGESAQSWQDKKVAYIGDGFLKREHGIFNLMPFVDEILKPTKIVPVMVHPKMSEEQTKSFVQEIAKLGGNNLLVASVDFSHNLNRAMARFHDEKTLDALYAQNIADDLEIDCPSCLQILTRYAQAKNKNNFHLVRRTSSGDIAGKDFPGENTSHIHGYYQDGVQEKREKNFHLLALGDLMIDRNIRIQMQARGVDFMTENVDRLFWSQDINILNLEGVVGERTSKSVNMPVENPNHFLFTFDKDMFLELAKKIRLNIVNDGNNHSLNFDTKGVKESREILAENKINYFGDIGGLGEQSFVGEVNGIKVAFVSYNQFSGHRLEETLRLVRKYSEEGYLTIVWAHWGTEYKRSATDSQKQIAHRLVKAGAEVIFGMHPHVTEPVEVYESDDQRGTIFYSLGNFIFDQYFQESVKSEMAVGMRAGQDSLEFFIAPFYHDKNTGLHIADEKQSQKFYQWLQDTFVSSTDVDVDLQTGYLHIERS